MTVKLPAPHAVRRVAIIGTGTIGASWAAHFLAHGMHVRGFDPAPGAEARTRAFIESAWPALERLGITEGADPASFEWCEDVGTALADAEFVQESAPENRDVKIALYESFDRSLADGAIMSTSTSGLLLSELQVNRRGCERYVVGHPFNPPHLIPLVEVLGGGHTHPSVVDWTLEFYNTHGKRAIRLNREVPGHLVNRMQAAVWREAVDAVATGLASVEDVDTAIAYGPGLRWALMGPHRIFHLAGGPGGMPNFLEHFGPNIERWWEDMRDVRLDAETKRALIEGMESAVHGRDVASLAAERDALLVDLLELLGERRAALSRSRS